MAPEKLMQYIAWRLVGFDVRVRIRQPATAGLAGEAHTGTDGYRYVDIKPGLNGERLAKVFLHELGHHAEQRFTPSNVYQAEPGSLSMAEETKGYQIRENMADTEADRWLRWGVTHADNELLRLDPAIGILSALTNYKKMTREKIA
jgi:hypothetical protein